MSFRKFHIDIDAIYARQSNDKKDSISIESQIEFCKYELRGGDLLHRQLLVFKFSNGSVI